MATAGSIRYARAEVEIGGNIGPLQSVLNKAQNEMRVWGASMISLGSRIMAAALAIQLPLGFAVKSAADFDQALADLRAQANPTAQEFAGVRAEIERIAAETGISPVEVTQGFTELLKAGKSVSEIMGPLGMDMVRFSRVSGMDMATTAVIMSDALNQFAKKGVSSTDVINTMNAAADSSTISLRDVSEAYKTGATFDATIGQSMKDTATLVGILGNLGVKGEEAGTLIKTLLTRMASGSQGAGDAMRELGLDIRDGVTREIVPLPEIIKRLQAAFKSVSDPEARDRLLGQLGGVRGIRGLTILLQQGTNGWADFQTQMETSLSVEQKFNIITDTMLGNFKKLVVQVTLFAIAIGESLSPLMAAIGNAFRVVIPFMTEFVKSHQSLVIALGAGVIALFLFGAALVFNGIRLYTVGAIIGVISNALKGLYGILLTIRFGIIATTGALMFIATGFGILQVAIKVGSVLLAAWRAIVIVAGVTSMIFWGIMYTGAALALSVWVAWKIAMFAWLAVSLFVKLSILALTGSLTLLDIILAVVTLVLAAETVLIALYTAAVWLATAATAAWEAILAALPAVLGAVAIAILALPLLWIIPAIWSVIYATDIFSRGWQKMSAMFSDSLDNVWARAADVFTNIGETIKKMFVGITDAQAIGDLGLAWNILKAGAAVMWFDIKVLAIDTFIELKYMVINIFQEVCVIVRNLFDTLWLGVKLGFFDMLKSLLDALEAMPWLTKYLAGFSSDKLKETRGKLNAARGQAEDDTRNARAERERYAIEDQADVEFRRVRDLMLARGETPAEAERIGDEAGDRLREQLKDQLDERLRIPGMAPIRRAEDDRGFEPGEAHRPEMPLGSEPLVNQRGLTRAEERQGLQDLFEGLVGEAVGERFMLDEAKAEEARARAAKRAEATVESVSGGIANASQAFGSFSGTAISAFGTIMSPEERTARGVEELNGRVSGIQDALAAAGIPGVMGE